MNCTPMYIATLVDKAPTIMNLTVHHAYSQSLTVAIAIIEKM